MVNLKYDLSKEAAALGAAMKFPDAADYMFQNMTVSMFNKKSYSDIFDACKALHILDVPLNARNIVQKLESNGTLGGDTTYDEILTLASSTWSGMDYHFIMNEVIRLFKVKMIAQTCTSTLKMIDKDSEDENILTNFVNTVDEMMKETQRFEFKDIKKALDGQYKNMPFMTWVEHLQNKRNSGASVLNGYSTGFPVLDQCLDGINKGYFIVIGARSGVGKSTFMMNLISNMAMSGLKVGVFSLEMTAEQLAHKFLCIRADVDYEKIRSGETSGMDYQKLNDASRRMDVNTNAFVRIDDQSEIPFELLRSRVKRMIDRDGVQVIFIDYITRLGSLHKYNQREERVQAISAAITSIAKDFNIPIICLAQINREAAKEKGRPFKHQLRESGQIEQDAHQIILLHRPDQYDKNDRPGIFQVYVDKNRFGKEALIEYSYQNDRFYELEKLQEAVKAVNRYPDDEF